MPITPVGYAIARSTASELALLQQQLAEVDPNDPQAIMQLQTKIAEVQQQIAQVEKEPGPRGQDATLYMGTVETLPPGSAATADMVEGHLNLGIPEGLPGQDAVLELGSVTTGSQASAEIADGVLNLTLPEPVDGKDATLEMGTLTTLAPGTQATANITDGKLNLGIPAGKPGDKGKDATLMAGTVTTVASGQPASASIDGGMLNLVIPQGQTGAPGAPGKDGQSIVGPAGPVGPSGPVGPAGPGLSIGATTTGTPGTLASATISDNRLNLTIPRGDTGATGAPGKDATVAIGTTSTGAAGSQAAAAIVDGKLNLTIPRGDTGPQGPQGPAGLVSIPAPTAVSPLPNLATAYQVTKTSMVSVCADVQYNVTLASTMEDIVELRIGPAADVATGGGILAASWRSSLTGISIAIGMGAGDRGQMVAMVPAGWYWALRRTTGTRAQVVSALIQQLVP